MINALNPHLTSFSVTAWPPRLLFRFRNALEKNRSLYSITIAATSLSKDFCKFNRSSSKQPVTPLSLPCEEVRRSLRLFSKGSGQMGVSFAAGNWNE